MMSDVQNESPTNYTPLYGMVQCSKAVLKVLHCILVISAIHSWFHINGFMKMYLCTYNFAQIYSNCPIVFVQRQGQLI